MPCFVEVARLRVRNRDPIVLGRPVYREAEFRRPPIWLMLIDKGDQLRGGFRLSIYHVHK